MTRRRRSREELKADAAGSSRGVRPRLLRAVSTAAVLAIVALAQIGLVLAPSQLGRNPLIVLALRPTPAFLVLVAGMIAPVTAVLIGAGGRTLVDVAYFAVARHGALPVAQRLGIGSTMSRGLSGRAATRGLLAVLFFWSSTPVIAALGLGRTPVRKFLAVTGAGNVATSAAYVLFGQQFAHAVAPVFVWVSRHGTTLTVGLAGAVAFSVAVALRRNRSLRDPADDRPALAA